jgi:NUMOD3 motif
MPKTSSTARSFRGKKLFDIEGRSPALPVFKTVMFILEEDGKRNQHWLEVTCQRCGGTFCVRRTLWKQFAEDGIITRPCAYCFRVSKIMACHRCGEAISGMFSTGLCQRCVGQVMGKQNVGPRNGMWKGQDVKGRHWQAQMLYPIEGVTCEYPGCDAPAADRHHIDGDGRNNEPDNIEFLCRRHHMIEDGRMDRLRVRMSKLAKTGTMRGKQHSEETKAKIKAAKTGVKLSDEHKANIRAGVIRAAPSRFAGKKHSEEAKAKMRAAKARRK